MYCARGAARAEDAKRRAASVLYCIVVVVEKDERGGREKVDAIESRDLNRQISELYSTLLDSLTQDVNYN